MSRVVVVTGATGNIGTKVRAHFASLGFTVRALCRNPTADPSVITVDLATWSDAWAQHFDAADAVIHLAGDGSPEAGMASVQRNNVELTRHVIRAAVAGNAKRVVFASSNWTVAGYRFTADRLTADLPPWPVNPYGASKLIGERLGEAAARQGLSFIALRIGWVQPGENRPGPHMALGRWGQELWLSNRDLCQAMERAVLADGVDFAVLNLMSDNPGMRWDIATTKRVIGYAPRDGHAAVITPGVLQQDREAAAAIRPPPAEAVDALSAYAAERVDDARRASGDAAAASARSPAARRGTRRLTLFAKGNNDLRDSLHSMWVGGEVCWNGINEIVRARFPDMLVRVRHEVWTRSDALLAATGTVPPDLAAWPLPLAPHTPAAQFSTALFTTDADAIVLSIQPDLITHLLRHRRDGYLFYPHNWATWPAADRERLAADFTGAEALDVEASMRNFERIVARIRERFAAPILVCNISAVVPGDAVHCHLGLGEILATRIRRFNLGVADLSARTGISVVDVDALLARAGAGRLKLDVLHLTPEGHRLVAEEVVRVLEDLGCLSSSPSP